MEEEVKKKNNKKKIVLIIVIAVIVIVAICVAVILRINISVKSNVGNTIANIRNFGYLATDDEYLYFMSPNDEGTAIGIRRIKRNDLTGTSEVLIEGNWEVLSLNYMDGYLYFITMTDPEDENSEDTVDNKIHKMKVDGSEDTVINDNEFNNDNYEIYVVKDKIYYIGTDECIYYMDLDGNNKTKLNDNESGFIGITEDYIFFNKVIESDTEDTESSNETYMMNLDGSDEHVILEGQQLYNISVVDDYIYYQTVNGYPSRVKLDGTDNTMISDEVTYNIQVTEDGIFYFNYYQVDGTNAGVAIYRMDLDGSNVTQLTKLDSYSGSLCEFDDWLFFSDTDGDIGTFELISKDGIQSIVLYSLDLSIYDEYTDETEESTETIDDSEEVIEDTTSEETTETATE